MAKIGTAHVEIKPVLNEEALDEIVQRIENAVEAGMTRALAKANRRVGTKLTSGPFGGGV